MKDNEAFGRYLPGTTISIPGGASESDALSMAFISGGLTLSQLCILGKTEGHNVQNWVRRGFVPPPVGKKYSKSQFCRIVSINMLGRVLPINDIVKLLSYVNGRLNDESDDIIGDDVLYILFVLALKTDDEELASFVFNAKELKGKDAEECKKIVRAVSVMKKAYLSSLYRDDALNELIEIDK